MNPYLLPIIPAVDDILFNFAQSDDFWANLATAFGTSSDVVKATELRNQWQSRNFSQLPPIEVLSGEVLGTAKGAYAVSTNKIYLSESFLNVASSESLVKVILEEIGHYVDAQINPVDTPGDEGEYFAKVVLNQPLTEAEITRLKTENDQDVVVIDGQSVQIEQAITLVGKWDRLSYAYGVTVVGNYAYAVGDTLAIIDISNPSNPVFKGNCDTSSGFAHDVQIVGNYAYLADSWSGLQIIDISNPTNPTLKGNYNTSGYAYGVQIVGNYAYVADWDSGLQIIDISNPTNPTLKGNYNTSGYAFDVQIVGNYAYVADWDSGLQIIDISNPTNPTLKGNYDTSGYAEGVQIVGNYAYVADGSSGLQIIDISNPTNPTFKGNYDTYWGYAYAVQIVGNYAYLADSGGGLQIINISNPTNPTLKGNYDPSGGASGVQIVGNYAYVADSDSGLQIIDISNPTNPTLKGNYDTYWGYAYAVQIVGNYAYLADSWSGLQIIDISNPTNPTLKGNYDTPGSAQDVQIVGNYAYLADRDSGLQIIDISNPTNPTLKGSYNTSGWAWNLQVVGNYAYLADFTSGLQIIDISNPTNPTLKGNYDTSSEAYDVQIVGNYAYLADTDSGLQIIDISNPTNPTLKGNYDTPGQAYGVQIVGNYAYVLDGWLGLQIIDISNPTNPTLKGNYDTSGQAYGVQIVGNYAYVADGDGDLQILDVSDFTNPSTSTITLAVSPSSVTEDGTANMVYTFTRSGVTTNALTVNYTVGGTATNGTDYTSIPTSVTFAANSSTATVIVDPTADTTVESDETVALTLATGTGYTIGTTTAVTGTITNDDTSVTLAVSPTSVNEDGTTNLVYTFTRSGVTTNALTVNYTVGGTATNGTDYTSIPTSVTFAANSATATVTVDPTADTTVESDETVALTLATGTGYTVGTTTAVTGTITNDDVSVTPIETFGNTKLVKDTTNKLYTQIGNNNPIAINISGTQITTNIYPGWQTLASETVNGVNQVLWKYNDGNYLHLWTLDSNWNWQSSTGWWGLNSSEAFTQETNFQQDFNGDGVIGQPYTPIEAFGNTKLVKDTTNKLYTQIGNNNPIAIKNGGTQITTNIYPGWQTLASETVNGVNQVLWKYNDGNYLHLWSLDSNWNWQSSTGWWGLNSSEAFTQETNFQQDFNGDGVIGQPYTPIEAFGNTKLVKDTTNKLYTQIGNNNPIAIKNGGTQITTNIYPGWQTLASETVNGVNQVLWKYNDGNYLHLWTLDSNWNWQSSTGWWGLNSSEAFTQETNFQQDFNGDGVIGQPYTPIEAFGNTKLVKDTTNKLYTQIGNNNPIAIKNGGTQITTNIYPGWQTLAAETVNGVNQVLWKYNDGNYLHLWTLDSNWNWQSSTGWWGLNSSEAFTQETNFQQDFNGDNQIGNPLPNIASSLAVSANVPEPIIGSSNDDILTGTADNNILIGGLGKDTITGGAGSDQFTFNNRNEGIDTITDFLSSQGDKIAISAAGFGGGLAAGVAITAAQFVLGTTALNASNRLIYNTITGGLFFDGDGTDTLAAIQIATLSSKPTLTASDIVVLV